MPCRGFVKDAETAKNREDRGSKLINIPEEGACDLRQSIRRKLIQTLAFFMTNPRLDNFLSGKLYKGEWKSLCVPGLNCHSCPASAFACPIGALQAVIASTGFQFSFYITGFLLTVGVVWGRLICGFLCPFGLFQELLHKVPLPKWNLWTPLLYVKYFILIVFVLLLPLLWTDFSGAGRPAFCEYICPAGTLEAGLSLLAVRPEFRQVLGALFAWKVLILALVIIGSMMNYRFFCKLLCPLGAIYGLLNRISLYRLQLKQEACVACGKCKSACAMGVNPVRNPGATECIRCGECVTACSRQALFLGFSTDTRKNNQGGA